MRVESWVRARFLNRNRNRYRYRPLESDPPFSIAIAIPIAIAIGSPFAIPWCLGGSNGGAVIPRSCYALRIGKSEFRIADGLRPSRSTATSAWFMASSFG